MGRESDLSSHRAGGRRWCHHPRSPEHTWRHAESHRLCGGSDARRLSDLGKRQALSEPVPSSVKCAGDLHRGRLL